MLASASIRLAFPPVFFEVEADGRRYDEMHVDGGVGARVFLSAGVFRTSLLRSRAGRGAGADDIYGIHNGQLSRERNPTQRSLRDIAMRVLQASGRAGVVGDLFRIYAIARREQATSQWVTIAEDVDLARGRDLRSGEDERALRDRLQRGAHRARLDRGPSVAAG